MDPKLAKAAYSGDVNFLKKNCADCRELHNSDYSCCFLTQQRPEKSKKKEGGNIFHLSGRNNRVEFFQEAVQILPNALVHNLLTQPEPDSGWNPLHIAAKVGHLAIVELIFGFYRLSALGQAQLSEPKPWLALDWSKRTPFHLGLYHGKDDCVIEMISMLVDNIEVICNMLDKDGNSLFFLAVGKGCNRVALHILMSVSSYSLSGKNGSTPLHYVMDSSEEVFARLLDKHPEYNEKVDYTVLRKWTESGKGKLWPLEYLLKTEGDIKSKRHLYLVNLIYQTNHHGNNIFHVAAKGRKTEAAKTLANVYRDDRAKRFTTPRSSPKETNHDADVPWLVANNKDETPMDLAMDDYKSAYDEYKLLRKEIIGMRIVTQGKHELLFLAIEKQLHCAAEGILDIHGKYGWSLYFPGGREIWDAALELSEQAAIWVAERMLLLTSDRVGFVMHSLYSVSENGKTQFVEWMLKKDSSALNQAPLSWIGACQKGHFSTIMAFINNCEYFLELGYENQDTPLHHIQFKVYEQYEDILKNKVMSRLKNFPDSNEQTPLHKAVENRNLLLAKLLLCMDDVFRSIKDKSHNTAMDLLVEACCKSWEWGEMCKQIGIVPGMKMTYFQDKSNLLEVRNTLSVVAVLLATITFTAGFTLPGGFKSDTSGKATLGNKAGFMIFLTADALAMCCSMLVLVFLVWSMVCESHKSLTLVNRSVPVLMLALYSTLVAFMTGVYVVIPHKSSWIAIVILVMCSIFIILSKRSIMDQLLVQSKRSITDMLLNKSRSPLRRRSKDKIHAMELGEASYSQDWIRENANAYLGGINSQQQKSE